MVGMKTSHAMKKNMSQINVRKGHKIWVMLKYAEANVYKDNVCKANVCFWLTEMDMLRQNENS